MLYDDLIIDLDNRTVTVRDKPMALPPKEFGILLFCARNQGRILTKQQIYEKVWKELYAYDGSNIMALINRLRKKIELEHPYLGYNLFSLFRQKRSESRDSGMLGVSFQSPYKIIFHSHFYLPDNSFRGFLHSGAHPVQTDCCKGKGIKMRDKFLIFFLDIQT